MWQKTKAIMIAQPRTVSYEKTVRNPDGTHTTGQVIQQTGGVTHSWTPEDLIQSLNREPRTTIELPRCPNPHTPVAQDRDTGRAPGDDTTLIAWPLNSCTAIIYVDGTNFGSRAYVRHAGGGAVHPADIARALAFLRVKAPSVYVIFAHSPDQGPEFYRRDIDTLIAANISETHIAQIELPANFGGCGITSDRILVCL